MDPVEAAAVGRATKHLKDASAALKLARARRDAPPAFSLLELMEQQASGALTGAVREYFEETARNAGVPFNQHRVPIPLSELRVANSGGYLVGTDVARDVIDTLRPWSVTARAGVTLLPNLVGNVALPRTNASATGQWLSTDTSAGTASDQTIGQITLAPKSAVAVTKYTRQVLRQTADVEGYLRRDLTRVLATTLDTAVVNGDGLNGAPLGLLNTQGFATQAGASLAWAGALAMKSAVLTANVVDDGTVAWLAPPSVGELLEGRERVTGSGRFIVEDGKLANLPFHTTTTVPAATLINGQWSEVIVGLWGDTFEFETTPFAASADFRAGIYSARVFLTCDVAFKHASAFAVARSIT